MTVNYKPISYKHNTVERFSATHVTVRSNRTKAAYMVQVMEGDTSAVVTCNCHRGHGGNCTHAADVRDYVRREAAQTQPVRNVPSWVQEEIDSGGLLFAS